MEVRKRQTGCVVPDLTITLTNPPDTVTGLELKLLGRRNISHLLSFSIDVTVVEPHAFSAKPLAQIERNKMEQYKDWSEEIAKQYSRFNEALGDVQDQMIVGHRSVAPGVYETTYENGKRIIVNYNESPYHGNGLEVHAQDFAIVTGGRS